MNISGSRFSAIASHLVGLLLFLLPPIAYAGNKADTIQPGLHGRFVLIHKARLWVELEGKGRPLFLLSGGPGSSHAYMHQFTQLRNNHLLVYLDGYGRGRSDTAQKASEYGLSRDVEDLEGMRLALGFDQIDILGHSYGGVLAQAYAIRYPAHVAHLILANTFFSGEMWQANDDNSNHEIEANYPEVWKHLMELRAKGQKSADAEHQAVYGEVPYGFLYAYNPEKFERENRRDTFMPSEKLMPHPHKHNPVLYYQFVGEDGDFRVTGDIGTMDFRKDLGKLTMPILIYTGRYDRVAIPKFAMEYPVYAPQATFVLFE
ncbi:MAG TPA: alpha/beta hydrolase, partial [Bacteroidia bacterium]|nr:alpha/beta hydrolase [Bacteroidia bacterium]